jgi:hypothetical protein
MSKTFRQLNVGLTVNRPEHLPDDMDDDAVVAELRGVVQDAIGEWYAERGHELVAVEPVVS